jgi:hypothetical protein
MDLVVAKSEGGLCACKLVAGTWTVEDVGPRSKASMPVSVNGLKRGVNEFGVG